MTPAKARDLTGKMTSRR